MARLYTLSKNERLTSRKLIDKIFKREGEIISKFPLSFVFLKHPIPENTPAQVMFSVPVKKIKNASGRNRVRRMMKESYRLHKPDIYELINSVEGRQYIFCIIYNLDKEAEYSLIDEKLSSIIHEWGKKIS